MLRIMPRGCLPTSLKKSKNIIEPKPIPTADRSCLADNAEKENNSAARGTYIIKIKANPDSKLTPTKDRLTLNI